MINKNMGRLINLIKMCLVKNKKGIVTKNSSNNKKLIKILIEVGLVKFCKIRGNSILIYINFVNNKPTFKNIKNFYKPSCKNFISLVELKKTSKKHNWVFIISTNKGLMHSKNAIELNVGGLLLVKLWN